MGDFDCCTHEDAAIERGRWVCQECGKVGDSETVIATPGRFDFPESLRLRNAARDELTEVQVGEGPNHFVTRMPAGLVRPDPVVSLADVEGDALRNVQAADEANKPDPCSCKWDLRASWLLPPDLVERDEDCEVHGGPLVEPLAILLRDYWNDTAGTGDGPGHHDFRAAALMLPKLRALLRMERRGNGIS